MNYYFITGSSKGIGKALTELLLQSKENFVYGLSRSNETGAGFKNDNFIHTKIDLNNLSEVKSFEFPSFENATVDSITLVNNSAASSEVIHLGKRSSDNIIEAYNVNIVSPSLLMNSFLKMYQSYNNCKRIILNISSGASKKAIESWSTYCASKSALDMISEVVNLEQKIKHPDNPVYVFSVGPGVVDTGMQEKLRNVSPDDFSMVGIFIDLNKNNQLADPKDIAVKLNLILNKPERFENVCFALKDI